jgi:hypothetical protein
LDGPPALASPSRPAAAPLVLLAGAVGTYFIPPDLGRRGHPLRLAARRGFRLAPA